MKQITLNQVSAGFILLIGSIQWLMAITLAESVYPGYSFRSFIGSMIPVTLSEYLTISISSSLPMNVSTVLLGLTILLSAVFIHYSYRFIAFTLLFAASGAALIGAGAYGDVDRVMFSQFLTIWLVTGSLSMIATFIMVKRPFKYLSLVLGLFSLLVFLFDYGKGSKSPFCFLGTGAGEIFLFVPVIIWLIAFAGYIIGDPDPYGLRRRKKPLQS